jgi:hypothetical protein
VFMDIDDGQPLSEPVDIDNIKAFNLTSVHDIDTIQPVDFEWWGGRDDVLEPTHYQLVGKPESKIHRDRLMIFRGLDAGINNRIAAMGAGESVADSIYRAFRNLDSDYNAASTLAKTFRLLRIKLAGFAQKAGANSSSDNNSAMRRLRVMKSMLSIVNAWVGGEQDDVEYKASPVQGYDKIVELTKDKLCWESGIPHTKLFGESPGSGLNNGKGESQFNDYANSIEDIREFVFRPQLNKPVRYLCALNKIKDTVTYEFPPLHPESPKEKAETREANARAEKLEAETALILIKLAIITRKEARSRYLGTGEYLHRMQITSPEPPKDVDQPRAPIPPPLQGQTGPATPTVPAGAADPQDPDDMLEADQKLDSLLSELPDGAVLHIPHW